MKSTDPLQDTLFRTIVITIVVTFVLVASTLLLDNLLDRTALDEAKVHGRTGRRTALLGNRGERRSSCFVIEARRYLDDGEAL